MLQSMSLKANCNFTTYKYNHLSDYDNFVQYYNFLELGALYNIEVDLAT